MKRIKRVSVLILSVVILAFFVPSLAAAQLSAGDRLKPRLVDKAQLLSQKGRGELLAQLDRISIKHQMDIVIWTVDDLGGKSPKQFADDAYDNNGYGMGSKRDGILLLLSMNGRDWWLSTCGNAKKIFTTARINSIMDDVLPLLKRDEFLLAFTLFADKADDMIAFTRANGNKGAEPSIISFIERLFRSGNYNKFSVIGVLVLLAIIAGVTIFDIIKYLRDTFRMIKDGTYKSEMKLRRMYNNSNSSSSDSFDSYSSSSSYSDSSHGGTGGKF